MNILDEDVDAPQGNGEAQVRDFGHLKRRKRKIRDCAGPLVRTKKENEKKKVLIARI